MSKSSDLARLYDDGGEGRHLQDGKDRYMVDALGVFAASLLAAAVGEMTDDKPWPQDEEIAIARSAGPQAVSADASVWVLGEAGYKRVIEGSNGFNCLVMRRWGASFEAPETTFDTPGGIVAPICYDEKASGAPMKEQFMRAELGLKGKSRDEIRDKVLSAYEAGEIKALDGVAFAYMYSAAQRLGPNVGAWHPHVMVYAPGYSNEMLGGATVSSGDPVLAEAAGTVRAIIAIPVNGRAEHIAPTARTPSDH